MHNFRNRTVSVLLLAVLIISLVVVKQVYAASTRNVYGYVFGLGTQNGYISWINVHDDTTGKNYQATYYWSHLSSGGLRWFRNDLPTNHQYTVTVSVNGFADQAQSKSFYLPSGYYNDQKIQDFYFSLY